MPLEYLLYSCITASIIIGSQSLIKRLTLINNFYEELEHLAGYYYMKYPETSEYYFTGLVVTRSEANLKFWVKDLNKFILNPNMLEDLYHGAQSYIKEQNEKFNCPWCDNTENFSWNLIEEGSVRGLFVCQNCGASCPVGTQEDCIKLMRE